MMPDASVCRQIFFRQWWINRHPHAHTRDILEGPSERILSHARDSALDEETIVQGQRQYAPVAPQRPQRQRHDLSFDVFRRGKRTPLEG